MPRQVSAKPDKTGNKKVRALSPKAALKLYRAKRDFKLTSEPSGAAARPAGKILSYLIQKHAARRLHYDFRLELDGVLKSWAVTRGPSLNPAEKRLAVHVEDHPLDYGAFEGTIPEGQYGGGTVMLWDRGSWEPIGDPHEGLAKGHLRFLLKGERLQGEWHLLRMKGRNPADAKRDNWLLIKVDDSFADHKNGEALLEKHVVSIASKRGMEDIAKGGDSWMSNRKAKPAAVKDTGSRKAAETTGTKPKAKKNAAPPPDFMELQLATLVDAPPVGDDWVHEIKFDGYRALARIADGNVRLLTRNRQDWTAKFQPVADALSKLSLSNALLDGEIVAVDDDGQMSFGGLQQALSGKGSHALQYYVFDLLFANGEDKTSLSLMERKQILRDLLPSGHATIHFSDHFVEQGKNVLSHSCQVGLEGIISKRKDAPYRSGRHDLWLKSKCLGEQEFVIGGFTYQPDHPGKLGALLIGYYEDKKLRFAGKVGTGFNDAMRDQLVKQLTRNAVGNTAFDDKLPAPARRAEWVKPVLVAQIGFTEWTGDGRLRHPVYKGLREDKKAIDVKREAAKRVSVADKAGSPEPSQIKPARAANLKRAPETGGEAGYALTNPDKMLYPNDRITKGEVAAYYQAVAPLMLPLIARRPLSLLRCPNGVGSCFFQRHAGDKAPPSLKAVTIDMTGKREPYFWIDDVEGLMAIVQLGSLEIHNWPVRVDRLAKPDLLIFDFDPGDGVKWPMIQEAAAEMHERLRRLKLQSFLKATGGHGLHVVVPLGGGKTSWEHLRAFAEKLAGQMAAERPDRYTINSRKAERVNRIYIDYLRNNKGASAIAPYSTRARDGGGVAMPLDWAALPRLKAGNAFTIRNAAKQIKASPSPWPDFEKVKQDLPKI